MCNPHFSCQSWPYRILSKCEVKVSFAVRAKIDGKSCCASKIAGIIFRSLCNSTGATRAWDSQKQYENVIPCTFIGRWKFSVTSGSPIKVHGFYIMVLSPVFFLTDNFFIADFFTCLRAGLCPSKVLRWLIKMFHGTNAPEGLPFLLPLRYCCIFLFDNIT